MNQSDKNKAYYAANREKLKARRRAYHEAHKNDPVYKAEAVARAKAYYTANRDEVRAKKAARYADDPRVRKADAKRGKRWRKENLEYDLAMQQERYQVNRAERLAKQKAYYAAHREERLEYAKQYQKENKEAHRQATERHRKEDPEATRIYNRAYYRRTIEHLRPLKAAEQRAAKRTQAPNRAKKTARDAVATALKNGTLVKPLTYSKCGLATTRRRLHAHHQDYSQPLVVTWLCSLCHGEVHQT